MDIYCRTCREPWDNDSLHEEVAARQDAGLTDDYTTVAADFRKVGCKALTEAFGPQSHCVKAETNPGATDTIDAVYEILGDDMDGAASMLDDAMSLGLI